MSKKEYKFRMGQAVRVIDTSRTWSSTLKVNDTGVISEIDEDDNDFTYRVNIDDSRIVDWFAESELAPFVKTLDTLEVGDVLVQDDDEHTVLAVCGRVILLSEDNNPESAQMCWLTAQELKEDGYTVKEAEEDVEELTVAEVEKRLGKRVKIIKED